mmetsp:Transcript_15796/g.44199  ORF Transcript_15796/g.44199 Transcript_15796/m.44199 type:complete len:123 (-) Transcript_15796:218-586(-)|eukprot:CAMPEP_0117675346 /NCGR_PEP_ID=MMETSP0804-20121206/15553_1 /TAXON_ID=1074897 /ORGANISM="Tetraselmis astigmatica, Strain CCMP880" /LENGTH=122 /DNA_ID=CAMNT_0005484337 /DNA_START=283 /DNA_END=651 /DNA_ORIENTATION=+
MKLLTHNLLACHIKGVKNGYPFKIEVDKAEEREAAFNPDFLRHIFPRLEWKALLEGAESMGQVGLPDQVTQEMLENEQFLKMFHHVLLEVHLEEGRLVCPETGRKFNVKNGIPNLLLNEDEC